MKYVLKLLFDPRGKLSRRPYFLLITMWTLISIIPYILSEDVYNNYIRDRSLVQVLWFFLPKIGSICPHIKRFHDLNMSGYRVLLLCIPIIYIYYQLLLLLKRSAITSTKNDS
jgi:uncharacterized membrane protein YhaH (DUF805 family)